MREVIQQKLEELEEIEVGELVSDDVVEIGTTYFGFTLQTNYQSSNMDKKEVDRISIFGFVVRKNVSTENTLAIIDASTIEILNKLKELNFKCNSEDITMTDGIRKIKITGYVYYDEINDKLVF